MLQFKSYLLAASAFPMVLGAQNLIKNGDAEANLDNWDRSQVLVAAENPHSGKSCFKTLTQNTISLEAIPVDASKAYKISGWFKSADDKKTNLFLGFIPLDADKKQIYANAVNTLNGSETELAAECKVDDTVLRVKDASKLIVKNKNNRIAFETDNSGALSDLPNSKITSSITKVEQIGGAWEITVEKPCGRAYPANTPVRIQCDGASYMYPVINDNFQAQDWKEFTAVIKGSAKSGNPGNLFWAGTKHVKIVILALNGGMLYFDDIKFEEVK